MNTTPTKRATDEKTGAGTGTSRLLHLLEHPEEHDGDGEQIGLKTTSLHVSPKVVAASQQASTTKLQRTEQPTPKAKAREVAPWMTPAFKRHPE